MTQHSKKKAPKAVKVIKDYARRTMFTEDVRIDPQLNQELWRNGIRNIDRRVEVILERKKNEDDEEAEEKMFTLVRLAK
jgi:large subunit ribosomal protein L31e